MCDTCGCGQPGKAVTIRKPGEEKNDQHDGGHSHDHDHEHLPHDHDHPHGNRIDVGQDILHKNNLIAERNRGFFEAKGITALNLVSSPGSGKTTLLERTIRDTRQDFSIFVIEGDQQTMQDAYRIKATEAPVIQVNTGEGCHLDSEMVNQAVKKLEIAEHSLLMIENVGNLICPALFDLGETKRVVIISVTEGDDKPLKYPSMFSSSDTCIINKIDLLPYVDFDMEKVKEYALRVNPNLEFIELSVKTGEGMEEWYSWLRREHGKGNG
jgi:hydrogenase nickel incorporation protein HypB